METIKRYTFWTIDWRNNLILYHFDNDSDCKRFKEYAEENLEQWGEDMPQIISRTIEESKQDLKMFLDELEQ